MIFIGADHRGFEAKEKLKNWLTSNNYEFEDVGATSLDPLDDYTTFAKEVAKKVSEAISATNDDSKGILLCGSGVGVDIVANKFDGIRSGLVVNEEQVRAARRDDNINILSFPADFITADELINITKAFLEQEFSGEDKYARRIGEINEIEQNN